MRPFHLPLKQSATSISNLCALKSDLGTHRAVTIAITMKRTSPRFYGSSKRILFLLIATVHEWDVETSVASANRAPVRRYSSFRQRLVHFRRRARLRGTRRLNNRHSSSIAAAKAIFSREVVGARIRASGLGHGQGSAAVTFHRSSKETPRVSGTHPGG